MTRTWVAAVLTVLLTVTACTAGPPGDRAGEATETPAPPAASEGSQPPDPAAAAASYDGEWQLVSGRSPSGKIPRPDRVTLEIAGRRIFGTAACNHYDAPARIAGGRFRTGRIATTLKACLNRRSMTAEERYLDALGAATRITRDGDTLRITGRRVHLAFQQADGHLGVGYAAD